MDANTLRPDQYRERIVDRKLDQMLQTFPAVEVAGTMWCGKTWTSLRLARSATRVSHGGTRAAVASDPSLALAGERPHLIDEWQDVPAVWDAVRDDVDATPGTRGSYILTGSSTPAKGGVLHSGAGRIARLRMHTMTLYEQGLSTGAVSLAGLFAGDFSPAPAQTGLRVYAEAICKGGWPALEGFSQAEAQDYVAAYLDATFDVSIAKRGVNPALCRRVAASLARNLGQATKLETLAMDAYGTDAATRGECAEVSRCVEAMKAVYMLDEVPGWDAPVRSKSRLRTKPKRYFADSSLAVSLLGTGPETLPSDGQLFGLLFESLCMHDLAVYASVLPGAGPDCLKYYRDSDGLEVDAIIELRDGRWAAFEIKLGEDKAEAGIKSLERLRRKIALNPAARNRDPEFMAVLVGAGSFARRDRETGVYVLPLAALRP
jgi:hypothetical protein